MTNTPKLLSAQLKLGRAQKLFVEFNSDILQFIGRNPYKIVRERDSDTGDELLIYYPTEPIPMDWAIRIGEILFNTRCALDHAVWQLTKEAGIIVPDRAIAFPILDNPSNFANSPTIRGLTQVTKDCIEKFQPYHAVSPEIEFIKVLNVLNNIDKHRELHLCCFTAYSVVVSNPNLVPLNNLRRVSRPRLNDRTELARWNFTTDEDSKTQVYGDVAFDISFDESSFIELTVLTQPEPISHLLESMMVRVCAILNELESFAI